MPPAIIVILIRCAEHHPQRGQQVGASKAPLSGAVKLGSPMGELSSVSETEGVSFVEWELLKVPDCTPFAASRHFPQRGQQVGASKAPLSGAVKLGSPVGELSSVSETEGVSFVEWELLKVPDCTPFAAARSTTPRCMIATGNHCYPDSLRGAPPQKGAARGAVSSFWLRGRRRCSILPGTGRPAGGSRQFAEPSSPRCCAGPGGRRCRRCPAA